MASEERLKHYEEVRRRRYPWMNEAQFVCFTMLCDLYRGEQHVFGVVRANGDDGISIITEMTELFATFDYDGLTRAVLMAHARAVRFQIAPGGAGRLRLLLHVRKRDGDTNERHPVIAEAIRAAGGGDAEA